MKREDVIGTLRLAGYHDDYKTFVRTYVENRISRKAAAEAYNQGAASKRAGVKCTCFECRSQQLPT